jgi:hypothetical protein
MFLSMLKKEQDHFHNLLPPNKANSADAKNRAAD